MNPPARLPTCEAELDDWRVYADYLIARGDPRGDVIALDLSLPADPSAEQLATFRALAKPRCRLGGQPSIGWTLCHARSIAASLTGNHGALAQTHDVVRGPRGALIERAWLAIDPLAEPTYRRVLAALPPTCRRVGLGLPPRTTAAQLDDVIARLPPHVRELELHRRVERADDLALHAISDRFDVIDLRSSRFGVDQRAALPAAIAGTHRVSVWLPTCDRAVLAMPRCRLGGPDDGALVGVDLDWACAIPRWSLDELQARHLHVPLRAQWARTQLETFGFQRADVGLTAITHTSFARRADRWTVANDWVRIDGAPLPSGESHELSDGMRMTVQGVDAVLLAYDVDARVRAYLAR